MTQKQIVKMAVFKNIPHVDRVIYGRTFMNEISLLFTYNPIKLDIASEVIARVAQPLGFQIDVITKEDGKTAVIVRDKKATISFTPNAVLVSLPTQEYADFTTTGLLWKDVEILLKELEVCPVVWSFTKGNRWIFSKALSREQEMDVYKVIFSEKLLENTTGNHIYVEESVDKSCVLTCRYGIEKINEKDSVGLKTMIASQSYTLDNLCEQVFSVNELMFDVWNWCINNSIKQLMKSPN